MLTVRTLGSDAIRDEGNVSEEDKDNKWEMRSYWYRDGNEAEEGEGPVERDLRPEEGVEEEGVEVEVEVQVEGE